MKPKHLNSVKILEANLKAEKKSLKGVYSSGSYNPGFNSLPRKSSLRISIQLF